MHQTLKGGTDAAGMVIFDPAALPGDFDARQKEDPAELLEQLTQGGRLYWLDTHSDGGYSLGVYFSNELPDHVKPYARSLAAYEQFHVPSGRLYFTGVEYSFRDDDSFLRKYPGMGEVADVTPGVYRADLFEFEYPEDFHEGLLRQRLPAAQFRIHNLMNTLVPIGCLASLAILGSLALLKWVGLDWAMWAGMVLPVGLVLIALPLLLARLPAYRQADAVYKDVQKEFPGYGILLRK